MTRSKQSARFFGRAASRIRGADYRVDRLQSSIAETSQLRFGVLQQSLYHGRRSGHVVDTSHHLAIGERTGAMAILELRGGTHLLLFRAKSKPRAGPVRSFDLMVDDVKALQRDLEKAGLEPGPMERDRLGGHDYFEVADPDGYVLGIYSRHG